MQDDPLPHTPLKDLLLKTWGPVCFCTIAEFDCITIENLATYNGWHADLLDIEYWECCSHTRRKYSFWGMGTQRQAFELKKETKYALFLWL
jgi:hypothetical protein